MALVDGRELQSSVATLGSAILLIGPGQRRRPTSAVEENDVGGVVTGPRGRRPVV